jgi:hypothetical protein
MVNVLLLPEFTTVEPGVILPPDPAVIVIIWEGAVTAEEGTAQVRQNTIRMKRKVFLTSDIPTSFSLAFALLITFPKHTGLINFKLKSKHFFTTFQEMISGGSPLSPKANRPDVQFDANTCY